MSVSSASLHSLEASNGGSGTGRHRFVDISDSFKPMQDDYGSGRDPLDEPVSDRRYQDSVRSDDRRYQEPRAQQSISMGRNRVPMDLYYSNEDSMESYRSQLANSRGGSRSTERPEQRIYVSPQISDEPLDDVVRTKPIFPGHLETQGRLVQQGRPQESRRYQESRPQESRPQESRRPQAGRQQQPCHVHPPTMYSKAPWLSQPVRQ